VKKRIGTKNLSTVCLQLRLLTVAPTISNDVSRFKL
jgi:hypothetical protein